MTTENDVTSDVTMLHQKIVTFIDEGLNQATITKTMKLSRRMSSYYFRQLQDAGYIRLRLRSSSNFYEVTKMGRDFLKGKMLHKIPHGMRELVKRGTHDLYLKYPITNPENLGKLPGKFWDKSWRVPNGLKKSKYIRSPAMTITLNQGWGTISAQVHDFEVNNNRTTTAKIFKTSWFLFKMFAQHEVYLNPEEMSVQNIHNTYEDDESRQMAAEGKRVKIALDRNREKLTERDPNQKAWVELDNSPGDNWETNDGLHDRRRALMPEKVHSIERGLNNLGPTLDRLTEQIELHLEATREWKENAKNINRGVGELRYVVKDLSAEVAKMRAEKGSSGAKMLAVEILKNTGKFYGLLKGQTHLYDLRAGARIYLDYTTSKALIKNGYAKETKA